MSWASSEGSSAQSPHGLHCSQLQCMEQMEASDKDKEPHLLPFLKDRLTQRFRFSCECLNCWGTIGKLQCLSGSRRQTGTYGEKTGTMLPPLGPMHDKMYLLRNANNNAQISLHISLISASIFRCLLNMVPVFAVSEIRILLQAFISEQSGLCIPWWHTLEDRFSYDVAHFDTSARVKIVMHKLYSVFIVKFATAFP